MSEAAVEEARARAYLEAGRYPDAETQVRTALAREPEDADLWCLLALCRIRQDDGTGGLDAANRAVVLAPDEEWPHRLASIALVRQKRYGDAANAAREAVRLDPELWQTHAQLALAAHEIRHPRARNDAWNAASRAAALAPAEAETHFVMGVVAQERGDLATAERAYRKALELDPQHAASMNNLGLLQLRRGRYREAAEGFTSSLRSDPRLTVARDNVEAVGWRMLRIAYYVAFAGFWVLRILIDVEYESGGGAVSYAVRAGVGVVLLGGWALLGYRTVGRLPAAARAYLLRLPRVRPGFAVMVAGVTVCVLGSLVAAFAPAPVALAGLFVAGGAILVSFVTSWVVALQRRSAARG